MIRDDLKSGIETGETWSAMHHTVKQFYDCGDGVYFPKEVELNLVDAGSGIGTVTSIWKNVELKSVNKPVSADQFSMVFPKDCVVRDAATEKGVLKWILWGDRNEPFKRVMGSDELIQLDKTPASRRSLNSVFWVATNCAGILLAGLLAWKFLGRKR